jgi:dipeptidase E
MRLLLISSSMAPGFSYLEYPKPFIADFLGSDVRRIAFLPFAGVSLRFNDLTGYDAYEARVQSALKDSRYDIQGLHREDAYEVLAQSQAVLVGGGNTFNLLKETQDRGLLEAIRMKVADEGVPYIGWSAGTNLACPTIRTTNDMPIVEPASFRAFGFVPFQINPHYLDASPDGHFGESRETRINEFLEKNRGVTVAGLREGMMFRIEETKIEHVGVSDRTCRLFRYGEEPRELREDVSCLLRSRAPR